MSEVRVSIRVRVNSNLMLTLTLTLTLGQVDPRTTDYEPEALQTFPNVFRHGLQAIDYKQTEKTRSDFCTCMLT